MEELLFLSVFFTIGSKGGIGKSAVAQIICEYLRWLKIKLLLINTDSSNSYINNTKSLKAILFSLMDAHHNNSPEAIPDMITQFASEEHNLLFDIGSNTYQAVYNFFAYDNGRESLEACGYKKIVLNVPIVSGSSYTECVESAIELAEADPKIDIAVWLNNGINSNSDPLTYDDFKFSDLCLKYRNIKHIVELPVCDPLRRKVVEKLNNNYLTMGDIADCNNKNLSKLSLGDRPASIVDKIIIQKYREQIFDSLKNSSEPLFPLKEVKDHFTELKEINKKFAGE